jgi:hypothetical protein
MKPKQPDEILTMCEGYKPLRDANKLLKKHGLVLRWRGSYAEMGDQVYLRVERLQKDDDDGRMGRRSPKAV